MNDLQTEVTRTTALVDQILAFIATLPSAAQLTPLVAALKAANDKLAAALPPAA